MNINNSINEEFDKGVLKVPYGSKVYWKTDNPGYIEKKGVSLGNSDELIDIRLSKVMNVGEIILWTGTDFISVRPNDLNSSHKESGYIPVGIVAISNLHNVYGMDDCGIIGLDETSSPWGSGTIDSGVTNINYIRYEKIPCIGSNGSVADEVTKSVSVAKLPSTGFNNPEGPDSIDGLGKYFDNSSDYAPSPYNSDGTKNLKYLQINSPSSRFNCLSVFNGLYNTRSFFKYSTTDYSAISYCKNYSLKNLGEWYLPSIAELGYVCSRLKEINDSIRKINEVFEESSYSVIIGEDYWTSTIGEENSPICINMGDGIISKKSLSETSNIRAFFRLNKVGVINSVNLTINPTPSDATVIINGRVRNTISVFSGSTISYEVFKNDYILTSGNILVENEDRTIEVTLDPAPKVGDIALWDNNRIVFSSPDNLSQHTSETPIGVVVIPSSHNVYENGCCCILGLGEEEKEWGVDGAATSETSLENYNNVVYIGSKGSLGDGSAGGVFDYKNGNYIYFSSDSLNVEASIGPVSLDGVGKYKYTSSYYIPSPYNSDGTRNRVYDTIEAPSDSTNATHDFSGKGNTSVLSGFDGFNAAKWCVTYKTGGTKEGDWFMPGYGELGYIFSRYNVINNGLNKINEVFSSTRPATILSQIDYWSSTEYSNTKARYLNFYEGMASSKEKNSKLMIRPCYQFQVLKTYTLTTGADDSVSVWVNEIRVTEPTIQIIAGTTVNYVRSENTISYGISYGSFIMDKDKSIPTSSSYITLEPGDYLLSTGGCLKFSELNGNNLFLSKEIVGVFAGNMGSSERFVRVMSTDEFTKSTRAWYGETSTPSLQSGYSGGYPIGATANESEARGRTQGSASTGWILNTSTSFGWNASKPAAEFARSYGPKWYLPAAGELELVRQNNIKIKDSVVKAGGYGPSIIPVSSIRLWVSTQATTQYAWSYSLNNGTLNLQEISYAGNFVLPMASY